MADQSKIWLYFQTKGINVFSESSPRLRYLADRAKALMKSSEPIVLNIGVGNGFLEKHLFSKGWEVHSLDPTEGVIKRLRQMGIKADVGYINAIPHNNNTFDVVFCSEVLEHLSDSELDVGIKEVLRVLKPGGFFLGTVPFKESLDDNQVVCPYCGKIFHRWGHQQNFDGTKIKTIFPDDQIELVKPKLFIDWQRHNLKRKIAAFIKMLLFYLGSHGSNETLYFQLRKSKN